MADKDAVTIQDIDYVTPGAKTSKTPEKKKSSSPPRGARVVPTKPAKKYESDSKFQKITIFPYLTKYIFVLNSFFC